MMGTLHRHRRRRAAAAAASGHAGPRSPQAWSRCCRPLARPPLRRLHRRYAGRRAAGGRDRLPVRLRVAPMTGRGARADCLPAHRRAKPASHGQADPRRPRHRLSGGSRPRRPGAADAQGRAPAARGRGRGLRPAGRPGHPGAGRARGRADLCRQGARRATSCARPRSTRCWSGAASSASAWSASRAATR